MPHSAHHADRRQFLLTTCGLLFGGAASTCALPGCRNRSGEPERSPSIDAPRDAPAATRPLAPGFSPPSQEPRVRVRIDRWRNARVHTTRVGVPGTWVRVRCHGVHQYGELARAPLTVRRTATEWTITDARGQRISVPAADRVDVHSMQSSATDDPATHLSLDQELFPGFLRFVPVGVRVASNDAPADASATRTRTRASADVDVINIVPMEAYLPGVLSRELFLHWKPATFEAQAVAARSFALHEVLYYGGRRAYDVTNTTRSQVYGGVTRSDTATDAVRATAGTILIWASPDGPRVVPGYYSSCCGGRPAAARDAIGPNPINAIPPLSGHDHRCPCHDAPRYRWTIDVPARQISEQLRAAAGTEEKARLAATRAIQDVTVLARTASGRPREFGIRIDDGDPISIDAQQLRDALSSNGNTRKASSREVWSSFLVPKGIEAGAVRFEGCGHGHGVGLCQYGAEALARAGHPASLILRWYYPGAEIRTVWEAPSDRAGTSPDARQET